MRVIAGKFRSRKLQSLPGMDVRPTSDKLRETLFNVLTAGDASVLEGTVWIDLFAGTGAVGIEAASRGASTVYFVESSAAAVGLIKKNLDSLGIGSGVQIISQSVLRALRAISDKHSAADYVFLDPPYKLEEAYEETLLALSNSTLLKPTTIVIAEHQKRFDPGETFGELNRYRKLIQGDAVLSFYRRTPNA
ncbi:MAG: 16S rRNA (guanine(966)-N(2))-methyltransferase RsmD [Acidobacteriaceae bacterium]